MNRLTVGIGMAAVFFGVYSLFLRITGHDKFGKLKGMRERYGEKYGGLIHLVLYCIVPVIFGIIMIVAGRQGYAIF